jgi:hypothetical protein
MDPVRSVSNVLFEPCNILHEESITTRHRRLKISHRRLLTEVVL